MSSENLASLIFSAPLHTNAWDKQLLISAREFPNASQSIKEISEDGAAVQSSKQQKLILTDSLKSCCRISMDRSS